MKINAIVGLVCLIAGVVVGGLFGARLERRSNDERTAAAVEQETARAELLEAEVGQLQERIERCQIHLRLGRIALEADRQDYGAAGERAARFFDDVARVAQEIQPGDPERAALEHVLAARDELIAGLATAQPAAAEKLKQLYLEHFTIGDAGSN
jgi:hypothetical protein